MESWREELYLSHHGIEGQKWGKRNGPPYPLDPSKDYSSEEKRHIRKDLKKKIEQARYAKAASIKSAINTDIYKENVKKKPYSEILSNKLTQSEKEYDVLKKNSITVTKDTEKLIDDYLKTFGKEDFDKHFSGKRYNLDIGEAEAMKILYNKGNIPAGLAGGFIGIAINTTYNTNKYDRYKKNLGL